MGLDIAQGSAIYHSLCLGTRMKETTAGLIDSMSAMAPLPTMCSKVLFGRDQLPESVKETGTGQLPRRFAPNWENTLNGQFVKGGQNWLPTVSIAPRHVPGGSEKKPRSPKTRWDLLKVISKFPRIRPTSQWLTPRFAG